MQPDEIYRVLGVSRDADAATVKRAYRALATQYHPDRNPSDTYAEQKFAEASAAYAAWSAKHAPAEAPGTARSAAPPPGNIEDIFGQFEQLFGDFFGGKGKRPARGADLVQPLRVTYVEARDGATRKVEIARRVRCEACAATGGPGEPCADCVGTGRGLQQQGFFKVQTPCAACAGTGRKVTEPCAACERGLVRRTATIDVTVPPDVEAGTKLRCGGKGDEHPVGPPGDLYLEIAIDHTNVLVRDGDDVTFETEVPATRVVLGGKLEVDTLDGRAMIHVPALVRDGAVITLAGRGHARAAASGSDPYRGEIVRGDQRVILRLSRETQLRRRQIIVTTVGLVAAVIVALSTLL